MKEQDVMSKLMKSMDFRKGIVLTPTFSIAREGGVLKYSVTGKHPVKVLECFLEFERVVKEKENGKKS